MKETLEIYKCDLCGTDISHTETRVIKYEPKIWTNRDVKGFSINLVLSLLVRRTIVFGIAFGDIYQELCKDCSDSIGETIKKCQLKKTI